MLTIAEMFLLAIAARIFYRDKIHADGRFKRRNTPDGGALAACGRTESRFSLQNGENGGISVADCGSSKCDGDDTKSNGRRDDEEDIRHYGTWETFDGDCVEVRL